MRARWFEFDMDAMRLGIVTENHFPRLGGMELATYALAATLSRLPDTSVGVACAAMPEVPRDFPYPYSVYRPRSFFYLTPYLYRQSISTMIRREGSLVLLGQILHGGGYTAVKMAERFHLPAVAASHGSDVQRVPEIGHGAGFQPEMTRRVAYTLAGADRILAVSRMNRDMILELGADPAKVEILPNGCLYQEIGAVPEEDLRGRYGLGPEDFVVITVGRNRAVKRMALLFKALALVRADAPHLRCLCVGPREDLAALVENYGLEQMVILTGRVPDRVGGVSGQAPPFPELVNLYRAADLYVSVSHVEAFNMSALDALAAGVPILVSGQQGVRDVMVEGQTGFTLAEETPEALASMLLDLSRRREELRSRRETIRQSVAHLSWDHVARQLRDLLLTLLA